MYLSLLFYPLIVLLYVLPSGRARWPLIAGTILIHTPLGYDFAVPIVETLQLSPPLESVLIGLVASFSTFIQTPTVGKWLLMLACVFVVTDQL